MDVTFTVSGVATPLWLPPLVALAISICTAGGGVSGAFLLLPFQMSVLGFVSPAVSPTNLVYNVVAIPGGVWRYLRERRVVWPLTGVILLGTLPGVMGGALVRLHWLHDPRPFKAFVGVVLLYLGARLLWRRRRTVGNDRGTGAPGSDVGRPAERNRAVPERDRPADRWQVSGASLGWRQIRYDFQGTTHRCSTPALLALSLVVGGIGGVYGIGGGAIIAPFVVAVFGLPVHTVAGAALIGTFVTSAVGVGFYQAVAPHYAASGLAAAPDWALGTAFGVGGLVGTYLGARLQRYVPARALELVLAVVLLVVAVRYVGELAMVWVARLQAL